MKKQNKQREQEQEQNTSSKQNIPPLENATPVSEEMKDRLVKQYRDRVDKASSDQNATPSRSWDENVGGTFSNDDRFKNGPEYGWPENKNIDVQYRPSGESLNAIHGEGLNGGPGDITQQQVDTPWNLGDNVVDNNVEPFTVNNLRNIVDAMSDDAQWEKSVYNEEHPDNPISDIQVGAFPRTVPRRFFSEYPEDTDEAADFLYNNPWNKGIQDYFINEGQYGWLYNNPDLQTQEQQADFSRMLNLLQGANDYRLRQEQADRDEYTRNRQLYGDALMELMAQRQTPQNNRSLLNEAIQQVRDQEILENRPSPRRRNITGSAVW